MERNKRIDNLRGILILFVVAAHFQRDLFHDIIFLFHIPLFFILSGVLLKREKIQNKCYLKNKIVDLMVPYSCFIFMDFLFVKRNYSINSVARYLWGGRAISGTYWYITCFLAALLIFSFLLKNFSDRAIKYLVVLGGGIAIIESHISETLHIFDSPGIPWNLDVALLALVYITIGFYYKENINAWINVNSSIYDVIATLVTILLIVFCVFNYRNDRRFYYFDMKLLYYKELISVILIPLAFGIVLFRLVYWISKCKVLVWLNIGLSYIGKMTVPIMFMHVPLNNWEEELGYGRLVYILIGVGIPLVVTLILNRFKIMRRIFGLQRM